MADMFIDDYVNLGDMMDFDQLSSFNRESLRKLEGRRILADYAAANEILDRHQAIIKKNNKKATFTLLEGNHDERIERYLDRYPNMEGMLEVPVGLKLKQRGFKWVKSWSQREQFKIGKLYFTHGNYINQYHAAKMVNAYGVNIVYGHTHDIQNFIKTIVGKDKHIMAQSLGYLADQDKLDYIKGKPNNWTQAFGIAEIRPDGAFNLYVITIINHTFTWNGKVYHG